MDGPVVPEVKMMYWVSHGSTGSGISVAMTIYCITNPKACFGSCPTYYADVDGEPMLQAEGFSASVAPALERDDIDALFRTRPTGERFELTDDSATLTHTFEAHDPTFLQADWVGETVMERSGEPMKPYNCISLEGANNERSVDES